MSEAIRLYRGLLRQAARFGGYNFRQYAIRRVRDGFISNRNLSDPEEISAQLVEAKRALSLLSRQVAISGMFELPHLVVENQNLHRK